jgi:hypothetical protein
MLPSSSACSESASMLMLLLLWVTSSCPPRSSLSQQRLACTNVFYDHLSGKAAEAYCCCSMTNASKSACHLMWDPLQYWCYCRQKAAAAAVPVHSRSVRTNNLHFIVSNGAAEVAAAASSHASCTLVCTCLQACVFRSHPLTRPASMPFFAR